jgi:hypothetical protein
MVAHKNLAEDPHAKSGWEIPAISRKSKFAFSSGKMCRLSTPLVPFFSDHYAST